VANLPRETDMKSQMERSAPGELKEERGAVDPEAAGMGEGTSKARTTRVTGDVVEIDYGSTQRFFDARGRRDDLAHPYSITMYQDANPALVVERDRHEKARILAKLGVGPGTRILDIGCGIGRWAEALLPLGPAAYLGLDFSGPIVEKARTLVPEVEGRVRFERRAAQDLVTDVPLSISPPFDLFLISGVLIYLNDAEVRRCLQGVAALADRPARLYLREPVAVGPRLSLDRFYSSDLKAEYSAIYRPVEDCLAMLDEALGPAGFSLREEGRVFDSDLQNRRETAQHFFIVERS
jgi:SAM-dependent methyltransferase